MTNWETVKQTYITTSLGYRELAQRFKVPYAELARRGREENWVLLRNAHREQPGLTVSQICHRLLEKVAALVENLPTNATSYSNLRQLSGTLKDIRELQENTADTATTVAVSLSSEVENYAE